MDPNSSSGLPNPAGQEHPKYIIQDDGSSLNTTRSLPETYGDNRLVVLPRDPLWFFAYWDATAETLFALRDRVGRDLWETGQATLRTYDVTGVDGDPARTSRFFDTDVTFDTRRWYVNVPEAGRSHVIELGFRFPDGRFFALLGSNRISMPRGTVSTQTDSRWMIVNISEWDKMFDAPDQFNRGSAETSKMMAQRWEFLRSVFSGSSSMLSTGQAPKNEETKR